MRPFVRLRIDRGTDSDQFTCNIGQGWDDKRSADWKVAASLPLQDALFPEEQRVIAMLEFLNQAPRVTALLQCEDGPPVRIDETVELKQGDTRVWLPSKPA